MPPMDPEYATLHLGALANQHRRHYVEHIRPVPRPALSSAGCCAQHADRFQRQVREVDHAALDRPRRILAIRELILAVLALVVAHERRVEILDGLGDRERAEHQVLIVAALTRVVDVELVHRHARIFRQVAGR